MEQRQEYLVDAEIGSGTITGLLKELSASLDSVVAVLEGGSGAELRMAVGELLPRKVVPIEERIQFIHANLVEIVNRVHSLQERLEKLLSEIG